MSCTHVCVVTVCVKKWDYTNFLVDLSGFYANCKALDRPEGVINVDRTTPDRQSVVAVVGTIEGTESDAGATTGYIEELIKRWMATNSYDVYVRRTASLTNLCINTLCYTLCLYVGLLCCPPVAVLSRV